VIKDEFSMDKMIDYRGTLNYVIRWPQLKQITLINNLTVFNCLSVFIQKMKIYFRTDCRELLNYEVMWQQSSARLFELFILNIATIFKK